MDYSKELNPSSPAQNENKELALKTRKRKTAKHSHKALLEIAGIVNRGDSYADAANSAREFSKSLPVLSFHNEVEEKVKRCTIIFTSGWPYWIKCNHVQMLIKHITDFNTHVKPHYVEVLQYENGKGMGAAFIKFTNNADCLRVYHQFRQVHMRNENIKVELDIDNNIAKSMNYTFGNGSKEYESGAWRNGQPCKRGRYVTTGVPMHEDYPESQSSLLQ